MTRTVPGREASAGRLRGQKGPAAPVTLVLSREVRARHEGAFEDVLHRLAGEARRQPGHFANPSEGLPRDCVTHGLAWHRSGRIAEQLARTTRYAHDSPEPQAPVAKNAAVAR
jgi:hypothetical protein